MILSFLFRVNWTFFIGKSDWIFALSNFYIYEEKSKGKINPFRRVPNALQLQQKIFSEGAIDCQLGNQEKMLSLAYKCLQNLFHDNKSSISKRVGSKRIIEQRISVLWLKDIKLSERFWREYKLLFRRKYSWSQMSIEAGMKHDKYFK